MMKRVIVAFLMIFSLTLVRAQLSSVNHWESLVYAEDSWDYFIGTTANPPVDWRLESFDPSSWLQGAGGFGYADGDDSTMLYPVPLSVFIRRDFSINDTSEVAAMILTMDADDGFVAWINGVEIARQNLGTVGDLPAYNTPATNHEAVGYLNQPYPTFLIKKEKLDSCLKNGNNILAI